MLNRKRIFAIVLFILIGLFVYTFANPAEELEPLDNDTNVEDVDKNTDDETDDEDVIQLPDQNININPQVVAVNYGVLRTAVDNGNVIVNLETEDEDLNNLLEQLETATNSGQQLITNQINDQNLVNNGANTINQLLTQINALLTGNLNEAIEAGNDLLDEYPEESNLNLNLIGLLEDLSDAIEEAGALKNPTAQQMLDAATEILDIIIEIEEFQADLDIINDMSLELVPSTTDWTNQDITLTAEIDIEDLDLIDDITIVRGDTCGLEENPTFSGLFEDLVMQAINTEEVTISENDDYTACVTFTNGELRSATYTVENIDKQAPIVSLTGGNINVEINTDFVEPGVTVTDNSGEIISPTLKIYYSATGADGTWVDAPNNIIDTTKLGSYNVWYKAKDSAGNLAIPLRRTVTVRDTIKPIVQLIGGDMVVEVNTPFTNPGVTITDNSNETLSPILTVYYSRTGADSTWTAAPNNMVDTTKLGKYAIWTGAKDSSGNTAQSKRRYVTVSDTIKPIVQLIGGDMVVEINTPFTNPGVTITDNSNETLSPILTVYYSATGADSTWTAAPNNMVDTTKLGKYAIWTGAKDSSGNTAESKRRYVTVSDTIKPIVQLIGGDMVVEINTPFTNPGVTITDNSNETLSPILTVYYSATGANSTWTAAPNNMVDTTKLGKYAIWTEAKDSSGNTAESKRRYVTVSDTIKPIVQLIGGDMVVEVNTPFTNPGVTITDNSNETLSPILTVYYSATGANSTWTAAPNNMVDTTKLGKYAIWIGAKDSSGNTAESKRRYVTVNDTIAPRITGFSVNWNYETVEVDKSKTYEDTAEVYTSDNSNGIVAVQRLGCNVEMGIPGDYKCQYKTTDESGNVAYNDRFIKVVDTTAPTISINNYGAQYDEGPIQLEIVGNDQNGVGLHTEAYSFNNEPWSSVKTATFSQNGPVNIKVRDANGNERSTIYTITNIVQDYLNFDTINTTDASGDDYWMTDRFAPMAFVSEMFGGDNRIKLSINQANAQIYGGFYGTQGRKILTGDATEISIDLYIPDSAATSGRRFAGFWGTAFNASNAVTGWPIIEFTSYNSPTDTTPNPRFRVWDSSGLGAWYDTGLPAGFQYNQWHRLTIKWQASTNEYIYLVDGIVISKINDTSGTVRLGEAMLQGYNVILPELTPNTMSYDIYWDNFVSKK